MIGVQEKKNKRGQSSGNITVQAKRLLASLQSEIAELQKALGKLNVDRRESLLAHVQKIQNDPKWLRHVRSQYTKEVSRRTLELNEALPLHGE
jgi:hypothetical protein